MYSCNDTESPTPLHLHAGGLELPAGQREWGFRTRPAADEGGGGRCQSHSSMEECDLLKERLQAITEKHRIQEDIRQKKLELDQEKLKLQHLKKKALREQWLLQDSASHNAADSQQQQSLLSDQQQTRALQLNIHRIEMEVEYLEREESMISTNESFILNRLKAVEKSPEEIIKEAQENFSPEPLQMTTGSHDQTSVTELSASEVKQLLRSATTHRQVNYQNYHQDPSRKEDHCFYDHPDERDKVEGRDLRNQGGHYGNHILRKPQGEYRYGHQESHYNRQEERHNQSNLMEGHHLGDHKGAGFHYGKQKDHHYSSYQVRRCHSVQENWPSAHHSNGVIRSNSRVNGGRPNGCPPPRSHDQEAVSAYQSQLCYTPANYIPLRDYISVDEEQLYCYNPPSYQSCSQTGTSHNQSTPLYSGPTHSDRVPSPLYGDDTPYTILNTIETTEPITAIFMGFQTAQDDSGRGQEFEGSLKAELVIIEDYEENGEDNNLKEKKNHAQLGVSTYSTESAANGRGGRVEGQGDRRAERRVQMRREGGGSVHLT
ncbi:palmdelphin-like isoform X2 [Lates japonicus]|uniref:Palmdelphin n=1 Tax=Lates japonicus TaxID=270547 RepID=A0AAD3MY97_LATJO|nr:palmdelphin-like isoform X2 [Lates japonicus]